MPPPVDLAAEAEILCLHATYSEHLLVVLSRTPNLAGRQGEKALGSYRQRSLISSL